ncbi:MAG: DUF357 domain-containing protein [archaeon]|nr:DUF357 domain-containing protein [archaeon]
MNTIITDAKINKYLDTTKKALEKLVVVAPEHSFSRRMADDFLNMALSYYNDAKHFCENGDFVTAFAAVNYAYGWIDCGARIGLWDVDQDDQLFTLYE